jgi:ribosomal protein S18 acetylase RimI-like enzyme
MSLHIADPPSVFEVHHLDFDTRLFGARMGSLIRTRQGDDVPAESQAELLADELRRALTHARDQRYAHLIYRAAAEDLASIWAAERVGLRLVDIGVDSTFSFDRTPLPEVSATPTLRAATTADMPALQDLAAIAFVRSRFVVDPFFSPQAHVLLHREWVKNLFGGLAQAILVCEIDGQIAGFVSCSVGPGEARIPLIATQAGLRRRGVGRALVVAALRWSAAQGVPVAHVKTQAHNYPALALYHRAGYVVSKTELTFSVTLTPQQHGDQPHV